MERQREDGWSMLEIDQPPSPARTRGTFGVFDVLVRGPQQQTDNSHQREPHTQGCLPCCVIFPCCLHKLHAQQLRVIPPPAFVRFVSKKPLAHSTQVSPFLPKAQNTTIAKSCPTKMTPDPGHQQLSHWLKRGFFRLTSEIPPLCSMLNFDADVKNTTARHQCENRYSRDSGGIPLTVRGRNLDSVAEPIMVVIVISDGKASVFYQVRTGGGVGRDGQARPVRHGGVVLQRVKNYHQLLAPFWWTPTVKNKQQK